MSTPTASTTKLPRLLGLIVIIFGAIFFVAGATTWTAVSVNLKAENITVSDDAAAFAGGAVDTPWEAFAQADIIKEHALKATGGKTYAELDKDDPLRATAMNGSFLRASLFTSVVAFGVALLVMGLGVVLAIVGVAIRKLAPADESETAAPELAASAA
ncbi:aromatic ring-opening dioxygenase LigA [Cellulomonas palmilytica]|uniref:aromatic ring-opening dioxygenase LigA n=1 Tax=Cellulomonas palmilytica TaxID=2608402 RepID=UPI001F40615C|nr:aromatic ring-opening dioxygenase LigA [Cellulomonas palmilytica]UJP39174.1 aromatic ring-opening dioxygenase LigA [Cellulomonas palmilytica]